MLSRAFRDNDFRVVASLDVPDSLVEVVIRTAADLLVLGMEEPKPRILQELAQLQRAHPIPVILFVERHAAHLIDAVVAAGVSACLVGDIQPLQLPTTVAVAMASFAERQALRGELAEAQARLYERKHVERAKAVLMERLGLSEQDAFERLRKTAMDRGQTLVAVARQVLDVMQQQERNIGARTAKHAALARQNG